MAGKPNPKRQRKMAENAVRKQAKKQGIKINKREKGGKK